MSDFVVIDNTGDEVTIEVTDTPAIAVTVSGAVPNTIIEVQDVALPVLVDIDGGTAQSIYAGIPPIDGGGA